ncbi:MAG: DUF5011 domain-containing protein [Clostridia bacterium]|nr:DUF5011 domain-containing protein [Clostridia bacterium]
MRILRVAVTIVFVVTTALFFMFFVKEKMTVDKTMPVIKIDEEILNVNIDATDEEFLQGVTAFDEKDGDITEKIIVESVSKFLSKGVCKVTYSVSDSNNNVTSATRKIQYKNYESPKFAITKSLCYSIYETIDLTDAIEARDCIDGNVSRNIIVTSEDFVKSVAGVFEIEVSVTNSKGDTSIINVPLVVEDRSISAPKIELSEYLIYLNIGETTDFSKYVVAAIDGAENNLTDSLRIESSVDFNKAGTYSVHYYVTDAKGAQGHTILNVIIG